MIKLVGSSRHGLGANGGAVMCCLIDARCSCSLFVFILTPKPQNLSLLHRSSPMLDAQCGALFDAYVERHSNPLGSLSLNVVLQNSLLKPQTTAEGVMTKAKAILDDLDSTSADEATISSAFKCLYLGSCGPKSTLALMKKHQLYVITLNSKRRPQTALQELSTMYNVLTASRKFVGISNDLLLKGIPPAGTEYPLPLLISFNFFVIQAILHLTSVKLTSVLRHDPKFNMSIFKTIANCFLSDSNLMTAIILLEQTLRSKYYSNAIKMVSGFIKIAEVLQKKLQSEALDLHILALNLKLSQFLISCGQTAHVDLSNYKHLSLLPFVTDFCNETNTKIPATLQEKSVLLAQPVTTTFHSEGQVLKVSQHPLANKEEVSQTSLSASQMSVRRSCASLIATLDSLNPGDVNELSNFSEQTISLLKLIINVSEDAEEAVSTIISRLAISLGEISNIKLLRLLARLCFQFGKDFSLAVSFAQTCDIDLKCCLLISDSCATRRLKTRIEYCLARIMDLQRFDLTHKILKQYLETFNIESAEDAPLDLFAHMITSHTPLSEALIGTCLKIPLAVQHLIVEKCCAPGEIPTFNGTNLERILFQHRDLFLLPVLHKIADKCGAFIKLDDLPPAISKEDNLYFCSILLSGLESGAYTYDVVKSVDIILMNWFEDTTHTYVEDHELLICDILEKLLLMGMFSLVIKHAENLLSVGRIGNRSLSISISLLAFSYMEMGSYERLPKLISDSGEALKSLQTHDKVDVNYNDVLAWKLLQLKHFIGVNDRAKFTAKIEEIKKIISSRPEYNFTGEPQIDLHTRLKSLYIISEFLKLVSQANAISGNHISSLKHSKFAIKLLLSIDRKLHSPGQFRSLKKKVDSLLLSTYQCSYNSARYLGLLKEALFYLDEIRRLTQSLKYLGAKQFWSFFLAMNYEYANRNQKALEEYEKGSHSVWNTPILCAMQLISSIILKRGSLSEIELGRKLEKLFGHLRDFESWLGSHRLLYSMRSLADSCSDLEYFISVQLKGQSMMHVLPKSNSHLLMLVKALIVTRSELSNMPLPKPKKLPLMVPTSNPAACLSSEQLETGEKLIECKEILMRLLEGNYLSFLDIAQIHDVQYLLNRCVFLLSSFAILKKSGAKDLLQTLFFLKDTANHLPFHNQEKILEINDGFIPETGIDQKHPPFHDLKKSLFSDLKQYLPRDWAIVTLDVCQISGDLLISRSDSQTEHPLVVQIPFNRKGTELSFKSVSEEIKSIVAESNKSTKSVVTSLVKTKEDRKAWWRARFELDMRLEKCLNALDQDVIGGFMGIFGSPNHSHPAFKRFKAKVSEITNILSSEFQINDNMILLFYNLCPFRNGTFDTSLLDDLLSYLGECFSNAGLKKGHFTKHLPTMRSRMIQLYEETQPKIEQGHLILIPSFRCSMIPWESMKLLKGRSVSRMPSAITLIQALKSHRDVMAVHKYRQEKVFYVVNPGKDLVRTQRIFEPLLTKLPGGFGIIGEEPSEKFILDNVFNYDLFIYMGHGGGEQYMRSSSLMKAHFQEKGKTLPVALLIGCSSSAYQDNGRLQESSNIFNWLVCGCPAVVTNLWDVTDKDIDTFSLNLFQKWGLTQDLTRNPMNLAEAMTTSRDSCTLKFLNGAAPILHGLPLNIRRLAHDAD